MLPRIFLEQNLRDQIKTTFCWSATGRVIRQSLTTLLSATIVAHSSSYDISVQGGSKLHTQKANEIINYQQN